MIGRPNQFDERNVLDSAMQFFRRKGRAVTTADLVTATGLGRQSLCHAFGDKKSLSQTSSKRCWQSLKQSFDTLQAKSSPYSNICLWLKRFKKKSNRHRNGCLPTNTLIELAPHHPQFQKHVRRESWRIETVIKKTVYSSGRYREILGGHGCQCDHDLNVWNRRLKRTRA